VPPSVIAANNFQELQPRDGVRARLFDWDGTLADSQQINFRVLSDALAQQGLPMSYEWFAARTGVSTAEMVSQVGLLHSRSVNAQAIANARDQAFLERASEVRLVPHVELLLQQQRGKRVIALATGGAKDTVYAVINSLGIADLFDVIVTREDVENGKPSPDIFLLASERLGVKPKDCLVYEDSDEGLQASLTAGMAAIDVRPIRRTMLDY
jgi:HAD superfamily hydrolase (TIGR01509 family)